MKGLFARWRALPDGVRRTVYLLVKLTLTVGAFYVLLTHEVRDADGRSVSIASALRAHVSELEPALFWPFILAAASIKAIGVFASMSRWHLLLIGQGIRFNFTHIVGSFLIGRFIGTFLPSTVGLDGYKLYDAARFSERVVEPAAATAVEKVMGLSGVFLTFLVTLPVGYTVLGGAAWATVAVTVPLAIGAIAGLFALLFKPGWMRFLMRCMSPRFARVRLDRFIGRLAEASSAYRGKTGLLGGVIVLSVLVHFCTAAMYFFTMLAIGAGGASFGQVSFASTIQIFATVISPFTIAGEGVREIVQALLLARHIGTTESILSAALGFWAAEALTLSGAFFWWARRRGYRPKRVEVSAAAVAATPPPPNGGATAALSPVG